LPVNPEARIVRPGSSPLGADPVMMAAALPPIA